jgi:transketolase
MKMLPGMTVINTCDFNQTKSATLEICNFDGPVYLRFGRPKVANFTNPSDKFEIGKGVMLNKGNDVTIVATGHLVWEAIQAAEKLEKNGINAEIINIHTIKPLDEDLILNSVNKTGCIVSAEEHNIFGGLGESIARLLTSKAPFPQEFVGTNDTFGESGTPIELMNKYGLNMNSIYDAVIKVIKRKV